MSDPLPDDKDFYASIHSQDALTAIGHFITTWAAVEAALPLQVARIIATGIDPNTLERTYSPMADMKATAALIGTPAKATLTQLENLAWSRELEIKECGDKIMGIKPKRDAVAHSLAMPDGEATKFHGWGASRIRMGTDKFYSATQMNKWASELIRQARRIDGIVTDLTGLTWDQVKEENGRFSKFLSQRGAQIPGLPPRSDSEPQAKPPEEGGPSQ